MCRVNDEARGTVESGGDSFAEKRQSQGMEKLPGGDPIGPRRVLLLFAFLVPRSWFLVDRRGRSVLALQCAQRFSVYGSKMKIALRERNLDVCVSQRPVHGHRQITLNLKIVLGQQPGSDLKIERAGPVGHKVGLRCRVLKNLRVPFRHFSEQFQNPIRVGSIGDANGYGSPAAGIGFRPVDLFVGEQVSIRNNDLRTVKCPQDAGLIYLSLFSWTIFRRALFISLRFFFSCSEAERSSRRV